ncbi:uncharacterized protein AB9W97_001348 isoform 1-T1 [Spinachia spinachia]
MKRIRKWGHSGSTVTTSTQMPLHQADPGVGSWGVQMLKDEVEGHVDSIYRCVGSVGELQEVQEGVQVRVFRWDRTSRSKDFLTTEVRATGLESLSPVILGFLVTGVMVEALKQAGTWHVSKEVLKMTVNTEDSCSAQCFRVQRRRSPGRLLYEGFVF